MSEAFLESVGWTMIHLTWVGGVVGVLTLGALWLLRGWGPGPRYGACVVGLALLLSSPVLVYARLGSGAPLAPLVVSSAVTSVETLPGPESPWPVPSVTTVATQPPTRSLGSGTHSFLARMVGVLPWVWLVGSLVVASGVLRSAVFARGLRSHVRAAPPWVQEIHRRLARAFRWRTRVLVGVRDGLTAPLVVGILRPIILIPPALLVGCTPAEMEMILVHEWTHIRRRDNLLVLMQRLVEILLFFHPVTWWLSKRMTLEREHCCDAAVVTRLRRPRAYARLLLSLTEPSRSTPLLVSGMASGEVVSRVREILSQERRSMSGSPRAGLVFLCLALGWFTAVTLVAQEPQGSGGEKPPVALPKPLRLELPLTPPKVVPSRPAGIPTEGGVDPYPLIPKHLLFSPIKITLPPDFPPMPRLPSVWLKPSDISIKLPAELTSACPKPEVLWPSTDCRACHVPSPGTTSHPPVVPSSSCTDCHQPGDVQKYGLDHSLWTYHDRARNPHGPWGATQATGAPDTPEAGDHATAWASFTPDGQAEWLELSWSKPIDAVSVNIYETFNPGAVVTVVGWTEDGVEIPIYRGKPETPDVGLRVRVLEVRSTRPLIRIRLDLDSPAVPGWNEIDAVGLVDRKGRVHWATAARASSRYEAQPMIRELSRAHPNDPPASSDDLHAAARLAHLEARLREAEAALAAAQLRLRQLEAKGSGK